MNQTLQEMDAMVERTAQHMTEQRASAFPHSAEWLREVSVRLYDVAGRMPPVGEPLPRVAGNYSACTMGAGLLDACATEIDRLRTECLRLREDAARLDWLDSRGCIEVEAFTAGQRKWTSLYHDEREVGRGDKIREAIDAARSSRPENPEA